MLYIGLTLYLNIFLSEASIIRHFSSVIVGLSQIPPPPPRRFFPAGVWGGAVEATTTGGHSSFAFSSLSLSAKEFSPALSLSCSFPAANPSPLNCAIWRHRFEADAGHDSLTHSEAQRPSWSFTTRHIVRGLQHLLPPSSELSHRKKSSFSSSSTSSMLNETSSAPPRLALLVTTILYTDTMTMRSKRRQLPLSDGLAALQPPPFMKISR